MKFVAASLAAVSAALILVSGAVHAYSSYASWASLPVTVFVNPSNQDVTATAAVAAVQTAMNVWNTQPASPFRFVYGGTVSDTATAHDHRNVAFFRNVSNGGTIATTYSWWDSSGHLMDADIIFWDGGFKFYTGSSGCTTSTPSSYIEDVGTHELGHALGLKHSSVSEATMYPTASYCSQAQRTLASDDINGVRALYGISGSASVNTAPTVVITSPANGAVFYTTSSISLAATATDKEDGSLSSSIQWTDNGVALGTGSLLTKVLSTVGTHTLVAKVTDSKGVQASSQVNVTVTLLSGGTQGTLTVTKSGTTLDGTGRAYLTWSGVTGTKVDVYRSAYMRNETNSGTYLDYLPKTTVTTYTYKVCTAGTQTCTNNVSITF
jgi:hypothetical protein